MAEGMQCLETHPDPCLAAVAASWEGPQDVAATAAVLVWCLLTGLFPDLPSLLSQEMARDEKNYYQDTPKQIKRKINVYKNFYPEEYKAFVASLKPEKMDVQ